MLGSIALASGRLRALLSRHPLWMRMSSSVVTGSLMIGLAAHLLLTRPADSPDGLRSPFLPTPGRQLRSHGEVLARLLPA